MPPWFMDMESATEIDAKSNGMPPASRIAAHASCANWPSSALHGVTRPSVEATPTKGLRRSASVSPRPRRNARCGARSSPSTVTREGRIGMVFFVFTHNLFDAGAGRKSKLLGARGPGDPRHGVHDLLQLRIGLELHLAFCPAAHGVPHLLGGYRDAVEQHGSP